jgi:hypothetical protein
MNTYDARQQLLEGLEQYIAGIETAEGLPRMAGTSAATMTKCPLTAVAPCKRSSRSAFLATMPLPAWRFMSVSAIRDPSGLLEDRGSLRRTR